VWWPTASLDIATAEVDGQDEGHGRELG
jgi:hypothetical protein